MGIICYERTKKIRTETKANRNIYTKILNQDKIKYKRTRLKGDWEQTRKCGTLVGKKLI